MKKIILSLLFSLSLFTFSWAESVFLKDGSVIRGKITESTDEKITVDTGYAKMEIPKSKVQNVTFDSNDTSQKESNSTTSKQSDDSLLKPETVYLDILLGWGGVNFNNNLNNQIKTNSSYPFEELDVRGLGYFAMDFYLSVNENLLFGGGLSGYASLWENNSTSWYGGKEEFSLQTTFYSIGIKYFFKEITSGFFINLAVGMDKMILKNDLIKWSSAPGLGVKGGIGYAVNFHRLDSCFIFGLDGFYFQSKYANDNWEVKGSHFYLGWLW
ncbi:MAG TPA: hypothetical protein DHW82_00970 [Spirochaetia bacterium]|nr:MAG: hypothetical protein A2Y41_05485 [Spirochaetes bacterium GWB1_36_13]HCL55569.1 hypothetical protein [Spirochaetia bacterium]